jgi:hypothetical protein
VVSQPAQRILMWARETRAPVRGRRSRDGDRHAAARR